MRKPRRPTKAQLRKGNLTLEAKLWICTQKQDDPSLTRDQLCKLVTDHFKLKRTPSRTTITRALQQQADLQRLASEGYDMKRKRDVTLRLKEFDRELGQWLHAMIRLRARVPDAMIREKARELLQQSECEGQLALSGGWLDGFKRRHIH